MLETEINRTLQGFVTQLLPTFNGYKVGTVGVQSNYQSRQAGIPDEATIFVHHIGRKRIGWLARTNTVNNDADGNPVSVTRTQKQRYESTFQFSALVPQSPSENCDCPVPTPVDVLDAAVQVLQSTEVLDALNALDLKVLRVGDVRSMWVNGLDREQFVNNPSFDIIIVHNNEFSTTVPLIDSIIFDIKRV